MKRYLAFYGENMYNKLTQFFEQKVGCTLKTALTFQLCILGILFIIYMLTVLALQTKIWEIWE